MSDKLSVEARAVMDLTSLDNATNLDVLAAVTRMEAAAEERGRRRGVEERDELRAALEKYDAMMRGYPSLPRDELIALGRAALAPRDSGKENGK